MLRFWGGEYASAAREGPPQAIQFADRFHIVKNLTEAVQVLLARCQAEILAEQKSDEPGQDEQSKPIISIEKWRPPESAHVEKVRLARLAGRYARYQQVVEQSRQGIATKEIAGRLGMSDRTVRDWLKQGPFPKPKNDARGKALLIRSLPISSNAGKMENTTALFFGEKSRIRVIQERIGASTAI
jgi:transposase